MISDHEVVLNLQANPRMTLFTGSSRVAEKLAVDLKGRVKLEDAGFDWKILGPDVHEVSYKIFLDIIKALIQFQFHNSFFMVSWFRKITLRGYVIKMHMHAVVRNARPNHYYLCMRFVTLDILQTSFVIK